jgi:small subunit ribosomal protein S6
MRNYELTFIVPSDASEDDLNGVISQIQGWVEESQGTVAKVNHWGRRRLAYGIREYTEGHYVSLILDMQPSATMQLERNIKLSGRVLRHLLIRADED